MAFKHKVSAADGRPLSREAWRVIPEFPKYEMTKDGDIRNRDTWTVLQESENKTTGAWYYSLWKDGHKHAFARAYQPLLYSTWPELLDGWFPIPGFPGYLVTKSGTVMGTRYYVELPKSKTGFFTLRRNGKRHLWCRARLGTPEQIEQFFNNTEEYLEETGQVA
jgi:hypothetical protein